MALAATPTRGSPLARPLSRASKMEREARRAEPEPPFLDGPYLLVAAAERLTFLPVNCTTILREWASLMDPVGAVRMALGGVANPLWGEWHILDRFVEPGWATRTLLRRAPRDESIGGRLPRSGIRYEQGRYVETIGGQSTCMTRAAWWLSRSSSAWRFSRR